MGSNEFMKANPAVYALRIFICNCSEKSAANRLLLFFSRHEISNQSQWFHPSLNLFHMSVAANLSSDPFSYPKDVDFHNRIAAFFPPQAQLMAACAAWPRSKVHGLLKLSLESLDWLVVIVVIPESLSK